MGRRVPRTVGWSFVAASLVASLGACSAGSAEPAPMPSVKPSPSTSTTPAGAPTMPAAARGTDAKAAKAFATYWVNQLNYATQTGNTSGIRSSSSSQCMACAAIAKAIARIYSHHGSITGRGWQPLETRIVSTSRRGATVDVLVQVHPQVVVQERGAKAQHFSGGRRLKTFTLRTSGAGWIVDDLDQNT